MNHTECIYRIFISWFQFNLSPEKCQYFDMDCVMVACLAPKHPPRGGGGRRPVGGLVGSKKCGGTPLSLASLDSSPQGGAFPGLPLEGEVAAGR